MPGAGTWIKMATAGVVLCIGGPALVYYVTPTEEELFKKYNPELQKRSLENRVERQQEFNNFVNKLKEYSKSNKPIWEAAAEDEERTRALAAAKTAQEQQVQRDLAEKVKRRKEEIRGSVP